jgi:hypothetical protein
MKPLHRLVEALAVLALGYLYFTAPVWISLSLCGRVIC